MGKHQTKQTTDIIKELSKNELFKVQKTKKGFKIIYNPTNDIYHCHTDFKSFHPLRRFITNNCNTVLEAF